MDKHLTQVSLAVRPAARHQSINMTIEPPTHAQGTLAAPLSWHARKISQIGVNGYRSEINYLIAAFDGGV
jgi:hypothetical protein